MVQTFFSIVLPTYNRLDVLTKVILPSIAIQSFRNFELIIVDDSSSDGTFDFFDSKKFYSMFPSLKGKIICIHNKKNMGSPKSRNIGINSAKGQWIFMVEDDLQIKDNNFLEKAKSIIDGLSESVGVLSPKRVEVVSGYYKNFNNVLVNYGFLSKEIYLDPSVEYSGVVRSTHACSFIRANLAKSVLYDFKNFYYYREESDFYESIKKKGFELYYVGDKLQSFHRMDLVAGGGNRKHSVSIHNQLKPIISHYNFVKKHFKFPLIRTFFFIFVRFVKAVSKITFLGFLKNILSFFRF